jgi:hypothetical protein
VILEDDETSTLSLGATAVSAQVDGGIESTVELNKQTGPLSEEAWYDVEDGYYVLEEHPLPPLEENYLMPMLAEDDRHSSGLLQDTFNYHNHGNTQRSSEEPEADRLHQPSNENRELERGENVSELEKDMLLAFEERDNLSSTNTPNSPHPHHPISQPAPPPNGPRTGSQGK